MQGRGCVNLFLDEHAPDMHPFFMRHLLLLLLLSLIACDSPAQGNVYPLDADYTQPWELNDRIAELVALRPDVTRLDTLGYTGTRHMPLVALCVSDNPYLDEPDEPAIVFVGPHHGEEVLGLEIVLNNCRNLLEAYTVDSTLTSMVNESEIWFVPLVNPEGWTWTAEGRYELKRKNDTDTNMDGIFDIYHDGVDLNKNYPFHWETDESTDPTGDYYKGPAPASEPEVQAMMAFFERVHPQMALFYHSTATGYSAERIYFPWRWGQRLSPDWTFLRDSAAELAQVLPRDYAPGHYRVFTGSNNPRGYARDYVYATHRTYAFNIESGGNATAGEGILHPPAAQMRIIQAKQWAACRVALAMLPRNLVRVTVLNAAGEPQTGVEVFFPAFEDDLFTPQHTDANGQVFRYLPPGAWQVKVGGQLYLFPGVEREVTIWTGSYHHE